LTQARMIDGLCQRYGCLPSALLAEDAHLLLPMVTLVAEYERDNQSGG